MKKIVTIGGGTGQFTVLSGLRDRDVEITATCTSFDSGGSSGVLRDKYGVLPPGDVRQALVALAPGDSSSFWRKMMVRRPQSEHESVIGRHSLGNIMIMEATAVCDNDPQEGLKALGKHLGIRGKVLYVSTDSAHLLARMDDGSYIEGETNIDLRSHDDPRRIDELMLKPHAFVHREVGDAIREADLIVICPGDIYTSIIPNLLVRGMSEALRETEARIVYISNLMTKGAESHGFKACDFVRTILRYSGLSHIDTVFVNNTRIPKSLTSAYAAEGSFPVVFDRDNFRLGKPDALARYANTKEDLIDRDAFKFGIIRHDSEKVALRIMDIL